MKSVKLVQIFSCQGEGPPHGKGYVEERGQSAGKKDALRWRC